MSLFSKFKREKASVDWSQAYAAEPKFYRGPDGVPFGAIALTEGTETILPMAPQGIRRGRETGIPVAHDAYQHHEGRGPGGL